MHTGTLPPTTIYSTWSEDIELWSVDDDTLLDLTSVVEATLKLIDPYTKVTELTLTLSDGDIVFPSTGIVQWRAEQPVMGTLSSKTYTVVLTLEDADDVVAVVVGSVSIVE